MSRDPEAKSQNEPTAQLASERPAFRVLTSFARLRTERLLLRAPTESDVDDAFAIHADPRANFFNPAGPLRDRGEAERLIADWLMTWAENGFGYWAVCWNDGHVLGFGGVSRQLWRDRVILNLYFRLSPDVWGRGIATELAREAVALSRTHFPALPVVARTRRRNCVALAVAQAAGLVRRPDLDDEHVVAALGWQPVA